MGYICRDCSIEFISFQEKANHIRWYHKNNEEYFKKAKLSSIKTNERRFGKWLYEEVTCSKSSCENKVSIKYRENKKPLKSFCSRSCSNSRGPRSQKFKEIVKIKISKKWKDGTYDNVDHTSKNRRFSSRKEREIVSYFKSAYKEDEWKSGGRLIYNGTSISRDLYSDKLRICIEYDGVWHFKDIHGQLEQKTKKGSIFRELVQRT